MDKDDHNSEVPMAAFRNVDEIWQIRNTSRFRDGVTLNDTEATKISHRTSMGRLSSVYGFWTGTGTGISGLFVRITVLWGAENVIRRTRVRTVLHRFPKDRSLDFVWKSD
jgi:hypothetical protein